MAIRQIVTSEDPILRKTSRKVEKFDETVSIEDLKNGAVIKKGKKIFRKFILE
jgi:peptide deformylase